MVLITNPQITESVNVQKMPVQREKTTLPEREVPVKLFPVVVALLSICLNRFMKQVFLISVFYILSAATAV